MARKPSPETNDDIASRRKLLSFLKNAQTFLSAAYRAVTGEKSRLGAPVKESLSILWNDSHAKLGGVIKSQEIGNDATRRKNLIDVGVFGKELSAKDKLFEYFLEEKRFLGALKLLASIFGSLSKVFSVMSAVKEFIDAVLCARDWLPDDPEITTIGDLR